MDGKLGGSGLFDNDTALDFIDDLRRDGMANPLREVLTAVALAPVSPEVTWSASSAGSRRPRLWLLPEPVPVVPGSDGDSFRSSRWPSLLVRGVDSLHEDMTRMTQSRSELELLREWVLEALDHLWCPVLPVKELKPYLEALHHQAIPPDMFPRLLQAERQAFDQNNDRAVWLGLGIRPDLQGEPNRWVRSDWPVWVRVVDPQGERVRAYWLLRQLYRAPVAPDAPGSTGLTGLWVQLSQQLPAREVDQMRGVPPGQAGDPTEWLRSRFEIWGEVADQLYVDHAAEDRERRQRLAERVASMDLATQLYGSGHPT